MSRVANGASLDDAVAAAVGRNRSAEYAPAPTVVRSVTTPTTLGSRTTDEYSDGSARSFSAEYGVTEHGTPATRTTFESRDSSGRVTDMHGWRTTDTRDGGSVTEYFGHR